MILTGTSPSGYSSHRIVLGISDDGHNVCAIRVDHSPELIVVPQRVTSAAVAEAIAEVTRIAEEQS